MEWISVKKDLPEEDRWVIICSKTDKSGYDPYCLYKAKYACRPSRDNKLDFIVYSDDFEEALEEITYWIYGDNFEWPD